MSAKPTEIEQAHYDKLVGRQIIAILWEDLDGRTLPILRLSGVDRTGRGATVCVCSDPELNGAGFLEHEL